MIPDFFLFFTASFLLSFASVWVVGKWNKKRGIVGIDINKKTQSILPESTGIALLLPLWLFSAYFFLCKQDLNLFILAGMVSLFAFVGFLDDIKPKFFGDARSWKLRAMLVAVISLAFAFICFKQDFIWVALISLYIAGLASFENTFAGLNGWEVGSGFIISVGFLALLQNTPYFLAAAVISASILALLLFNIYPAKVFPGDSGTMLIGSALAGLMVLTKRIDLIIISFFFFLPHMLDFALKLLSNPKDPSQRKSKPYYLNKEGKLDFPQQKQKKYDFAKLLIKVFKARQEQVLVLAIWLVVLLNMLFWLNAFGKI